MSLPRSVRRLIAEKKAALRISRTPATRAARNLDAEARFAQALEAHQDKAPGLVKRGNTKQNPKISPEAASARLDRAATEWLAKNDPSFGAEARKQRRKDRKARLQAARNTALVGRYRKGMHL